MKYIDVGCNINCWECKKDCAVKNFMELSIYIPDIEPALYSSILESLKAQAGLFIVKGVPLSELDEEVKITAVSFYVARLKIKEQLAPENQN